MNYKNLLSTFALRESEKDIFFLLVEHGQLKAGQIAKLTGTNRTSVYDYIENLKRKGLLSETKKGEVGIYSASSPEKIRLVLEEQSARLSAATESLVQFQRYYSDKSKLHKPRLAVYEGQEEVRQMMKDLLLYNDITVMAYWPIKSILKTLGDDFVKEFQKKRLNSNIRLKTIWPADQVPDLDKHAFLKPSVDLKREVRIAPRGVKFNLGYIIYGNTVRFLSSSSENYGFTINSYEFAEMMKTQFEMAWEQATRPR
jgi:HTH-type transcriptional regulator, sugar sensing transcriptional regulator